jgi:ABC-type transporter Mla subunit MlaD
MRKVVLVLIVAVGFLAVLMIARPYSHRLLLKTYLGDAHGLRRNAQVRIAGVEVGTVTDVRARPDLPDGSAEVTMSLHTDYDLRVPDDATVTADQAGILGETFLEIDVHGATGPPAHSGEVLKSRSSNGPTTQEFLEHLADLLSKRPCVSSSQQATGGREANAATASPRRKN